MPPGGGSFSPLTRASASRLIAAPWVGGTASRQAMINRMRKGSQGSGATSKPAKPVSTAFYEELFNKFKDSEERRRLHPARHSTCSLIPETVPP